MPRNDVAVSTVGKLCGDMRRIAAATLILVFMGLSGCKGGLLGNRDSLSFAQYNSLEKGMSAKEVRAAFGSPTHVLERDGKVVSLTYTCENSTGDKVPLKLLFSPKGRLDKWALG